MLVLSVAISFAIIGYFLAKRKNRNKILWAILGSIFTILSITVLFFLPKIKGSNNEENLSRDNLNKNFEYFRPSKVAGVTFKNDDGSDRQSNIKRFIKAGNEAFLKAYEYKKGKWAVAVLAFEDDMSSQIGNLNQSFCDDFLEADPGTEFEIIILNVTGGTYDKPTYGVNFECFSTARI